MLRTSPARGLDAGWFRWGALAVVLAGAVLWAVTGSWQWMATSVVTVLCVPNLYYSVAREDVVRAALSTERLRKSPPTTGAERLADGLGLLALAVAVSYALWVGPWWWGVVGAVVWLGVSFGTSSTAFNRMERRLGAARSRFAEANALGSAKRFHEAVTVFDDIIADLGDDPFQRARDIVALALSNKALFLRRANRRKEAEEVYRHLIAKFSDDPSPDVQRVVGHASEMVRK
jgi:hypothetical protein